MSATKATLAILRHFKRGYDKDPNGFWLANPNKPSDRVVRLADSDLLERCDKPGNFDLFRLAPAGLALLKSEEKQP